MATELSPDDDELLRSISHDIELATLTAANLRAERTKLWRHLVELGVSKRSIARASGVDQMRINQELPDLVGTRKAKR